MNATFPGLTNHLSYTHTAVGSAGEQLAYLMLEQRGYIVSNVHPKEQRGDLRVVTAAGEILRVEIKTARRATDKKWRFTLRKKGHSDHIHSDVVILLCVMKTGYVVPFVIPTPVLQQQNAVAIASDPYTYAGKYAQFRQKMHLLNLEIDHADYR